MVKILFEDIELPNPVITSIKKSGGAYTWEIDCYTTDITDIDALNTYAFALTTEISTGGLLFVRSGVSPGVLQVQDPTTLEMISNNDCYLQGPIDVGPAIITPDGAKYVFTIIIQQSAITMG